MGFSVEFGCYDPHSAKTPSAYHVKSITRYAGGVFILSAYTAFGVSHFSKEDVRCVSHKESSGQRKRVKLIFMPSLFSINSTAPQLLTFLIQRIPDRNHTIFCLYFYLFCMFKQPAQAAVLVPLRIRVVRRHIRGKEHIAQQCVDCGKGAFLLCRQLAVFFPEEEPRCAKCLLDSKLE